MKSMVANLNRVGFVLRHCGRAAGNDWLVDANAVLQHIPGLRRKIAAHRSIDTISYNFTRFAAKHAELELAVDIPGVGRWLLDVGFGNKICDFYPTEWVVD